MERLVPSRLVFGLGRIHHLSTRVKRERLVAEAIAWGFRRFDVAPSYGNGLAERTLGRVTASVGCPVQVNTKYGIPVAEYDPRWDGVFAVRRAWDMWTGRHRNAYGSRQLGDQELYTSLARSQRRLGASVLDCFFLHEPIEGMTPSTWKTVEESMQRLIATKTIREWGVAGSTSQYRWDREAPSEATLQLPFLEWRRLRPSLTGRRVILYGLRAAHAELAADRSFLEFLWKLAEEHSDAQFVVATNHVERLQEWFGTRG